jgi:predicted dehydrogenase
MWEAEGIAVVTGFPYQGNYRDFRGRRNGKFRPEPWRTLCIGRARAATILVEYPKAQGIIQASWNWPINRKDLEVYGERGLAIATGGNGLRVRMGSDADHTVTPEPRVADERDSISHLIAVVRGARKPNALSSLENNVIVTAILEAARESARTHQRVVLR